MGLFDRLFGGTNSMGEKAKLLVPSARAMAISLFQPATEEHPCLAACDLPHWDYILTMGAVFSVITQLNRVRGTETAKDEARDIIGAAAVAVYPSAFEAVEDCTAFFDRTADQLEADPAYRSQLNFVSADALGGWVAWNMLGREPNGQQELMAARFLGTWLISTFWSWWNT